MNPAILQLILPATNSDQLASQCSSKTKKNGVSERINISDLPDFINGEGSFACLLKQTSVSLPIETGKSGKETLRNSEMGPITGKDEAKKELTDITIGTISSSMKEAKETDEVNGGIGTIIGGRQVSSKKDVKTDHEILSSVGTDIKTNGLIAIADSGKFQFISKTGSIDTADKLNLKEEIQANDGISGKSQSTSDKKNEFSVKKGISESNSMEKLQVADTNLSEIHAIPTSLGYSKEKLHLENTNLSEGELINNSEVLKSSNLKSDKIDRNDVTERMKNFHSGNAVEDDENNSRLDISKGFNIKELSVDKGSSDVNAKEREALSSKSGAQNSESTKEDPITTNQVRTVNEKAQIYKNTASDIIKSERSIDGPVDQASNKKIDTSPLTTQVDFSGVKGIWNGAETSRKSNIIAPINFQDIANQIVDSASNIMKKDSGRIVIKLEPPNLGTLNMDVRVNKDAVTMLLVADNNDVKQALNSNLDQLKTALHGQGLNVDRLDVLVHDKSYDSNQGFQPGGGTLFDDGRERRKNTREDTPSLQILPSGVNELNEPSLGIISLFV